MRFLTTVLALVFAASASADTIDRPISSGTVTVKAQSPDSTPDLIDATSLGIRRMDTLALVFCVPIGPGEIVLGETDLISSVGSEVLLQAFGFVDPGCTGIESLGSETLYRVVFGAPGLPMLLAVP